MTQFRIAALAVLLALSLVAMPMQAQAQDASAGGAQQALDNYDPYRAAAITTGIVVGSVAAIIVTDGLILPVVSYASGGPLVYGGVGHGMIGNVAIQVGHHGYQYARAAAGLFGAVSGGLIGDAWYGQ